MRIEIDHDSFMTCCNGRLSTLEKRKEKRIVNASTKTYLASVTILLATAGVSGCVVNTEGEGTSDSSFINLINKLFGEEKTSPQSSSASETGAYQDYKKVTNSIDLIASSNTSTVSIGIFDDGFMSEHVELSDRTMIKQNYDDISLNIFIEDGTYTYTNDSGSEGKPWEWANHGTASAAVALGLHSGIAPQAEAVTSMNRGLASAFDASDYFDSFTKNSAGIIASEGVCVQHIYSDDSNTRGSWFPWCINFTNYHVEKIKLAASYDIPAINVSSTIPFGHFQTGIDLSFNQTKWDDNSYLVDWDKVNLDEFRDLYFYDYNESYDQMRRLLASGDVVMVISAGNYGKSLSQEQVLEWQNLQRNSSNPDAQTIVNKFFDPDIDTNANGVIEDNERGISKGMLYVGALDKDGYLAWYSNTPGSVAEVQSRFIVAPGHINVATPSNGEEGYSFIEGTSNSAPIVSGAIALLKVNHPAKSAREIAEAILTTASKDIPNYDVTTHGQGLLDVAAADAYLR